MLMAELAPTAPAGDRQMALADLPANDTETGEVEPDDTAGLLKLLLVAHDIAAPDHHPVMPAATSDDDITAEAYDRTATEMLTGAIEILKSLEAGPRRLVQSKTFRTRFRHRRYQPWCFRLILRFLLVRCQR